MNDNVISQKGGLHNRVTRKIKLSQFNLRETSLFLARKGIKWTNHQIAECYMVLGGTPYYLDLLRKGYSLPQNVDFLFFRNNAELDGEYDVLLKSLFKDSQTYRRVIELLAKRSKGMTRKEMCEELKFSDGGAFTTILENLRNCDFIRSYSAFGKKDRDTMYQLGDMFILFYLKFVKNGGGKDEAFWSNSIDDPARRAWSGYAFEQLCLSHIPQIKEALGIRGILSMNLHYRFAMAEPVVRDGLFFYVITFTQAEGSEDILYSGRLYVESESLAIGRVELSLNVKGREEKAAVIMVIKRPPDTRFYVTKAEYAVNYKRFGDVWHYDYSVARLNLSARRGKSLFRNHYSITSEMAVTAHNEVPARIGADERIRFKDILSEKVGDFRDDDFWGDYNVIEPDKSIDAVIRRIIRRLERRSTH